VYGTLFRPKLKPTLFYSTLDDAATTTARVAFRPKPEAPTQTQSKERKEAQPPYKIISDKENTNLFNIWMN